MTGTKSKTDPADQRYMRQALAIAARGLGCVWPNPAVGCVVVRDGVIVGRGWTGMGGRPHAETEALARAKESARGATAYVSLEPCAHHGETPPCADALVEAGVARVVAATEDPDPRVQGRGLQRLRDAGIEVTSGVLRSEAEALNAGFIRRVRDKRPLVTLKVATTLDGRIATQTGESKWITGETARRQAHVLRAAYDAIMIGIGTVVADDPELTCRLPGLRDRSPIRVVLDGRMQLPLTSALVKGAGNPPTWLLMLEGGPVTRREAFEAQGVEVTEIPSDAEGYTDIRVVLETLAERGITRLLVEGGSRIAAALLRFGLVDRLVWFRAGSIVGGDGVPAVAGFGLEHLAEMRRFVRRDVVPMGDDLMETYERLG